MNKTLKTKKAAKSPNQGEGNVSAALAYNKGTAQFIKSGQVAKRAQEAKQAIEGPEGNALAQAEKIGKSRGIVGNRR